MPDDRRGARSPRDQAPRRPPPESRAPPQIRSQVHSLPSVEEADLPLPSDRRVAAFKALAPYIEAISGKLQELKHIELIEEQIIKYHRIAFGAQVALLALQALAPTAVPSLWWALVSRPILSGVPTNSLHWFWYLLGIVLWIVYALYHVTQGALLRRTESGWPYSPLQAVGLAVLPFFNAYGSWVLFSEATTRLGRETGMQARGGQARSAVLGSLLLSVVGWGLELASGLGVEIPELALQASLWLRIGAQLIALVLTYWMMHKLIRKFSEEGGGLSPSSLEDAGVDMPIPRGPAAPPPGLTMVTLLLLLVGGLAVYLRYREPFECPKTASLMTTRTEQGQRVLYCEVDGLPEGPWRILASDGVKELTYLKGRVAGSYRAWYRNGNLKETGVYKNQSREGLWRRYSEDGVLLAEESYAGDVLSGAVTRYYPSGKPAEKAHYLAGKLHGSFVAFHENGVKAEEGSYQEGEKVDHWITRSAAGLVTEDREHTPTTSLSKSAAPAPAAQGAPVAQPGTALPAVEMAAVHEVTETRLYAGRTLEWWAERLNGMRQRVESGGDGARVYELTRRRAQQNGLEVLDGADQEVVKVRVARGTPQGGPP